MTERPGYGSVVALQAGRFDSIDRIRDSRLFTVAGPHRPAPPASAVTFSAGALSATPRTGKRPVDLGLGTAATTSGSSRTYGPWPGDRPTPADGRQEPLHPQAPVRRSRKDSPGLRPVRHQHPLHPHRDLLPRCVTSHRRRQLRQSSADEVSTDTSATVGHRTLLAEPDEEDTDQENASTTGRLTQRSDVEDTLRPLQSSRLIYCSFCLRGVNQGALLGGVGRGPGVPCHLT